jgi:hypothetical protein
MGENRGQTERSPVYPQKNSFLLSIFPPRDDYRMNDSVRKAVLLVRRPF